MEMRESEKETPVPADVLPDGEEAVKGPSRARVIVHLAGIGLGFLLLLVGSGLGFSRNMWDKLALVPLIAGGALVAGWITVNHGFLAAMIRNRRVMVGANALFMGVLAIVLATMANFISTRHYWKWDFTKAGLFTLSEKTQNVLKKLDRDVTIITFRLAKVRTGEEETYARLRDLMKLYTQESPHIKVEYAQPDADPQATKLLVEKYNIDVNYGVMADDLFVVCGDKKKVLRLAEMMEWEYLPGGNPYNPQRRPVAFKGEQFITSALIEVTEAKQAKLYALSGHGERNTSDPGPEGVMNLAGALKRDNLLVENLGSIPDAGVPVDCDCLVIFSPRAELIEREISGLRRYLERGGRLLVCLDWDSKSGLEPLLEEWGVTAGGDLVITQDATAMLGSMAAILVRDFGLHDITKPMLDYSVAVNFARSISTSGKDAERLKTVRLLNTTQASYGETDLEKVRKTGETTQDPAKDAKGPLSLAVAVEEANPPKGDEGAGAKEKKLARIVVFGDADMFSNNILKLPMANLDLCRNAINWLVERKDLIAISSRPEVQHIMVVDSSGKNAVFWLMVVGMPLAMLLVGGVVWALRSYGSRAA